MTHSPKVQPGSAADPAHQSVHLSTLPKAQREDAIAACSRLTGGLDLSDEIQSMLRNNSGEVVLTRTRTAVGASALCAHPAGTYHIAIPGIMHGSFSDYPVLKISQVRNLPARVLSVPPT